MAQQLTTKNLRAMMNRWETSARRIEKEFERQLKAIDQARASMQKEGKKQLDALRREQRGFLVRMRKAAKPAQRSTSSRTSRSSTRRPTSSSRRMPARRTTTRRAA
jgi:hypothetical protein